MAFRFVKTLSGNAAPPLMTATAGAAGVTEGDLCAQLDFSADDIDPIAASPATEQGPLFVAVADIAAAGSGQFVIVTPDTVFETTATGTAPTIGNTVEINAATMDIDGATEDLSSIAPRATVIDIYDDPADNTGATSLYAVILHPGWPAT